MRNRTVVAVSILVAGVAGCMAGGRKSAPVESAAIRPTPELIEAAAPALAEKLNDWHGARHADQRLLIRGPTFVGLDGVLAPEAALLAATLVDALNDHLEAGLRLVPAAATDLDPFGPTDVVLDSRIIWESPERRAEEQEPSLILDIVNPRDGDVLVSARHRVAPAPAPPEPVRVAVAPPTAAPVAEPDPAPVDERSPAPTPPPVAAHETSDPTSSVPEPAHRSAFAFGARPDPMPSASGDAVRSDAEPSAILRLEHGIVYFENARLARRIAVVQGQASRLPDGRLRVRHVMTARKKSTSIELHFEFYDAAGQHAGTVDGVDFRVWTGRGSSTAVVSRLPAERYVLFIKD